MTVRRTRLYWPSLSRQIAKGRSRWYPDPERTKYRTKELLARTSGEIEYARTEPTCSPLSERETSYQYVDARVRDGLPVRRPKSSVSEARRYSLRRNSVIAQERGTGCFMSSRKKYEALISLHSTSVYSTYTTFTQA